MKLHDKYHDIKKQQRKENGFIASSNSLIIFVVWADTLGMY